MDILLPHDGSEPARHASEFAVERLDPDAITALYVFDPSEAGYDAPDPFGGDRDFADLAAERADEVLPAVRDRAPDGVELRTAHEVGHPARTIVEYAESHEVDHVVVGSHGRDGISRLLLGSVAETVVRRSPVPVTVVR